MPTDAKVLPFPVQPFAPDEPMNFSCTTPECRVMVFQGTPRWSHLMPEVFFSLCPTCTRPSQRPVPKGDTSGT